MTTEAFLVLYGDEDLHEYIRKETYHFSKNIDDRDDLEAWAWAFILEIPRGDMDLEYYKRTAYNAMQGRYRLDRQERCLALRTFMERGHLNWGAWNYKNARLDDCGDSGD